jgi:hypothetical protein
MSACKFNIPFSGSAEEILNKAKATVEKQGGEFKGNNETGSFHVSAMGNTIAGSYAVTGNDIEMTIDTKPFFISCDMVESFLKSKLA